MLLVFLFSVWLQLSDVSAALPEQDSLEATELSSSAIEDQRAFVICRNNDLVRTIRIRQDEGGRCETLYSKGGQDRVVGYGHSDESCSQFLENIKGNLQEADWKCREISKVRVMGALQSP